MTDDRHDTASRGASDASAEFIDDLADRFDLADVVSALADTVAATPPTAVRIGLLATIAARPRRPVAAASVPDVYAARVAAMAALLAELDDGEWSAAAAPYDWTVRQLVVHLTVIEEYTLRQLGLTDLPPVPVGAVAARDHLRVSVDEVAAAGPDVDPLAAVRRWRVAADRIVAHVQGASFDPSRPTPLHAWPFDASTALVARAFEIWTHADDIRRATGRPLDVPPPSELRTMSSLSVGGLPALVALAGVAMEPVRVVLTGPGGGTFDLGPGGSRAPHDADGVSATRLVVADVVDYCRVVARRIDPADLPGHRDRDDEFVDALLRAASAIAV